MNTVDRFKKFVFKGQSGLDTGKVYSTLFGKSYDDLDNESKAKWEKAYKKNLANLDKMYWLKREEINSNAFKNPSYKTEELRELEIIASRNNAMQSTYEYYNSGRPDNFDATADWNNRISKMDENQLLEEVLRAAPQIRLAQLSVDNSAGVNKSLYSGSVKHTKNDKYYDSLISKANQQLGTNFKSREDVAAFLKLMGAKKVDGIIGPETEALLDAYHFGRNNNWLNNRQMYSNKTNSEVLNNTFETMVGAPRNQTVNFKNRNYIVDYYPGYNYYPSLNRTGMYTNYVNPYTRYLRNLMSTYKSAEIGPSPYY